MEFEQAYFIDSKYLDDGNRILLPPSALPRLTNLISRGHSLIFEVGSYINGDRVSHCGVLEFTSEEGYVRLPKWMIKNLQVEENEVILLKNATLPKGTYMKIQPHETKFIELSEGPKEILERALRSFACVTTGDTIMITHGESQYFIDIVETKPSKAISLVETDCILDFAPPLDYKEPEKPVKAQRIPAEEKGEAKFKPFAGVGRRLNGESVPVALSSPVAEEARKAPEEESVPRKYAGRTIFGAGDVRNQGKKRRISEEEEENKEKEKKFKAFAGKGFKLN